MRISNWSSDVCSSDLEWRECARALHRIDREIETTTIFVVVSGAVVAIRLQSEEIDFRCEVFAGGEPEQDRAVKRVRCVASIGLPSVSALQAQVGGGIGNTEERRGGKECVSTGRYGWWPYS